LGKFKIGKNKFKGSIQAGSYFSFLHSAAIREVHITLSNPLNSGLKADNRRNTQSIDIGWKIAIGGELNNSDKTTTYFIRYFASGGFTRIDDFSETQLNEKLGNSKHLSHGLSVGFYFNIGSNKNEVNS